MQYATLDKLKAFLKITGTDQDEELEDLIVQATALVDIELGDNLGTQTVTRKVDGTGQDRIILENRVNSVSSVTEVQTGDPLEVDFIEGAVVYMKSPVPRGRKNVEISYAKGYSTVPADMERYFLHYCRELLTMQASGDTETVKSQSLGGGLSLTYFSPSELSGRMVGLEDVIAKYRNFTI